MGPSVSSPLTPSGNCSLFPPPSRLRTPLSSVPRAQLHANLQMQLFSSHACARRRRTHLAPQGPCCGDRSGGQERKGTLKVRVGQSRAPVPCSHSVHPGIDPSHTAARWEAPGLGSQTSRQGKESVPELSMGLQSQKH